MYLAQNSNFYGAMDYAINSNVVIGTNTYTKPSVISISWGAPEIYVNSNYANIFNTLLAKAVNNGINITVATGDYGSTSGIIGGSNIADFPSSSPNVIACGGTRLVCPNNIYDSSTVETVWNNAPRTNGATGGGISRLFRKGAYQSKITQSANFRCAPDISLNADPETGIQYIVNGKTVIYGGTSTVSPAMAAVISILNINYFLNTRLYTLNRNCFHDIINGNNGGYTAGTGYDLCSGLGSLRGSNFVAALNPVSTTGITITSPMGTRVIKLKGKLQLTATLIPTNANNKNINWSSSNKNIIRVSSNGLCTANRLGTATITASQGNIKASISITVYITSMIFNNI
jgi:subtilase family serine protease